MKKIILVITTITLLILGACKKETGYPKIDSTNNDKAIQKTQNGVNSQMRPVILYQASNSFLNNSSSTFITNYINNTNSTGVFPKAGHWSVFSASSSIIESVVRTSGDCASGTIDITYQVTTIESEGVTYGLSYSATLLLFGSNNATSYTELSATPYNNSTPTVCGIPTIVRVSKVTFSIPTTNYENTSSATIRIKATSTSSMQAPYTISQNVSFTYPNDYYTLSPAKIIVGSGIPGGSGIGVYTQCSLACYSNHVICPTGGVFSYRLAGTNNPFTNVSLNYSGAFIPTSSGTYEYSCILTYSFGTSLPFTGTIVVP
jgi:hypothetical protein